MASARRSELERWCTTAIEMAKSKAFKGCGSERMSATATECGWCCEAMVTRLEDLGLDSPYQNRELLEKMPFLSWRHMLLKNWTIRLKSVPV